MFLWGKKDRWVILYLPHSNRCFRNSYPIYQEHQVPRECLRSSIRSEPPVPSTVTPVHSSCKSCFCRPHGIIMYCTTILRWWFLSSRIAFLLSKRACMTATLSLGKVSASRSQAFNREWSDLILSRNDRGGSGMYLDIACVITISQTKNLLMRTCRIYAYLHEFSTTQSRSSLPISASIYCNNELWALLPPLKVW